MKIKKKRHKIQPIIYKIYYGFKHGLISVVNPTGSIPIPKSHCYAF